MEWDTAAGDAVLRAAGGAGDDDRWRAVPLRQAGLPQPGLHRPRRLSREPPTRADEARAGAAPAPSAAAGDGAPAAHSRPALAAARGLCPSCRACASRSPGSTLPHPVGLAAGFDKNAEAHAGAAAPGLRLRRDRHGHARARRRAIRGRGCSASPPTGRSSTAWASTMTGIAAVAPHGSPAAIARSGVVGVNIGMNKDAADPAADYRAGLCRRSRRSPTTSRVNVSSPNTPGLRALQKRDALARPAGGPGAGCAAGTPLFLKIAPDLDPEDEPDIAELCLAHRHRRADRRQYHALAPVDAALARGARGRRPERPAAVRRARPGCWPAWRVRLGGRVPLIGVGGDRHRRRRLCQDPRRRHGRAALHGADLPGPGRGRAASLDRARRVPAARDGFDRLADAVGAGRAARWPTRALTRTAA